MAYYSLEPFGEQRGDYRAALVAAAIINTRRKKGARAVRLEDLLLFPDEEDRDREPGADELLAKAEQISAMFRGQMRRQP